MNLKNIVVNSNSNFILNFENQNLRKTFQNFLVTCNVMKKIQKHFSKIEIKFMLRKNIWSANFEKFKNEFEFEDFLNYSNKKKSRSWLQ